MAAPNAIAEKTMQDDIERLLSSVQELRSDLVSVNLETQGLRGELARLETSFSQPPIDSTMESSTDVNQARVANLVHLARLESLVAGRRSPDAEARIESSYAELSRLVPTVSFVAADCRGELCRVELLAATEEAATAATQPFPWAGESVFHQEREPNGRFKIVGYLAPEGRSFPALQNTR
jgi:hypothetical protein